MLALAPGLDAAEPEHPRFLLIYSAHNTLVAHAEATAGAAAAFDRTLHRDRPLITAYAVFHWRPETQHAI